MSLSNILKQIFKEICILIQQQQKSLQSIRLEQLRQKTILCNLPHQTINFSIIHYSYIKSVIRQIQHRLRTYNLYPAIVNNTISVQSVHESISQHSESSLDQNQKLITIMSENEKQQPPTGIVNDGKNSGKQGLTYFFRISIGIWEIKNFYFFLLLIHQIKRIYNCLQLIFYYFKERYFVKKTDIKYIKITKRRQLRIYQIQYSQQQIAFLLLFIRLDINSFQFLNNSYLIICLSKSTSLPLLQRIQFSILNHQLTLISKLKQHYCGRIGYFYFIFFPKQQYPKNKYIKICLTQTNIQIIVQYLEIRYLEYLL
ncbi:unnamed protein product (macronuclear) [Paramecium tetraurelia]|uniref:Transmembrane protein n=1 Tax=Paramecium tetraurelia TaxID=5888 RepID=A0DU44_PARTE|nr:uncharacterized protein GSPATT00020232001 [Paramecium tetraurelia]CAK86561.1 unnamed protein product [Paramecium tetraurelia]|eukprot:XP_001453958.1 hypothetical protein (macronuclear) [Paramecium tetraurelia strain d4-2]